MPGFRHPEVRGRAIDLATSPSRAVTRSGLCSYWKTSLNRFLMRAASFST
jgi:hypothetical protein